MLESGGRYGSSALLQEEMCYLGQQLVFDEASSTFDRLLGIAVNAKQIERVCHHYGECLESQHQQAIAVGDSDGRHSDHQSYYAMVDGGMVLTREEKWKEMKLARIFNRDDRVQINKNRSFITQSTYIPHLGGHKQFLEKVELELDTKGSVVFIADGAKWIWRWIEAMYPESEQILDFYHARQHLCQWAEIAFKEKAEKDKWLDNHTLLLLNDRIDSVIENIRKFKTRNPKSKKEKDALIAYYTSNRNRMMYKTYKEKGLLIGSGPIEAAHRNVIQQRMKLSGQRWTMKGAQQIANLRAKNKGNQWDVITNMINKAA